MPAELPDLGARRLVIEIAVHDRRPAQHHLAGFVRPEQPAVVVHDAHGFDDHRGPSARQQTMTKRRVAHRLRHLDGRHEGGWKTRLGLTEGLTHHRPETLHRFDDLFGRKRRGGCDQITQRREIGARCAGMRQQHIDERGRQKQRVDPMLADEIDHGPDIGRRHHDRGATELAHAERHEAAGMRDRRNRQIHRWLVVVQTGCPGHRRGQHHAVGADRELGAAGGAAGGALKALRVFGNPQIERCIAGLAQPVVKRGSTGITAIDAHQLTQAGHARPDLIDHPGGRSIEEEHVTTAGRKDMKDVRQSRAHVQIAPGQP